MPTLKISKLRENFPILKTFMDAVVAAGGSCTTKARFQDVELEAQWSSDPDLKVGTLAGELMMLAREHGAEFNQKDP